jgi:ABC-type sugar transport system ATPase subunit
MATDALPAIEIRGLTKRFLSTLALDGVDLTIMTGEIHALVGENGAGKSTRIKVLAGLYQSDAGEIFMSGRQVHPHSESVPIAFVHQDLGLIDELSIGENVALVAGFPARGRSRGDRAHDLWRSPSNGRNNRARCPPYAGRLADRRAHQKRNCAPGRRPTR